MDLDPDDAARIAALFGNASPLPPTTGPTGGELLADALEAYARGERAGVLGSVLSSVRPTFPGLLDAAGTSGFPTGSPARFPRDASTVADTSPNSPGLWPD